MRPVCSIFIISIITCLSMCKSIDLLLYSIYFYISPSHKISVIQVFQVTTLLHVVYASVIMYLMVLSVEKNHKNTKYMHIFNLLFLYTKNMGIYSNSCQL